MAHLAGALGRPTMVPISAKPDWRWLRGRADCPWYPTMTLVRQERLGDWKPVFARIAATVAEKAAAKGAAG
jgi:hypothetical protein